jgi:hypothetical protein
MPATSHFDFRHWLAIALLGAMSVGATAEGASHCVASETSMWSCSSKQKVYELCASKNLGKSTGYLQYRAGRIGKIELSYPRELVHPKGLFHLRHYPRNGGLAFKIGQFEYELFDPLTEGGSQLRVFGVDSKPLRTIHCAESNEALTNTEIITTFTAAGLDE